ncbi:MAG: 4-(cytidine 5'-diphospho)-2-C-methyl-D-erythritol kinase [Planctomycetota bacterium]
MLTRATSSGCLVLAPAKINLSLEVLGRRPDGFHELRTVMSAIRLFDTLHVAPAASGVVPVGSARVETERVACDFALLGPIRRGATAPTDGSNLVVRALEELAEAAGQRLKACVRLFKRIPSQAGLGGGSADAAAALVAGNQALSLCLPDQRLRDLGARLGSDVPFFVDLLTRGRSYCAALCEGRGERSTAVPNRSGLACVIVKPQQGLSTAEVYRACEPAEHGDRGAAAAVCESLRTGVWRGRLTNSLQPAALRLAPWLSHISRTLAALPVLAHQMSGSGTACFALCRSAVVARRVAGALRARGCGDAYQTAIL